MLKEKLPKREPNRGKQTCYQTKRGQMQVLIGCPYLHEIRVWTTHKLMHEHVGKHAKMQRSNESQAGGTKQARQAWSEEKCVSSTPTSQRCISRVVTSKTNHQRDRCNHTSKWPQRPTSTNPRSAQSMAKPKYRQANIEIKHRSMQKNIGMHKGNDPNPLIQAQVYGCRPRPRDLDLHPTQKAKMQEKWITRNKRHSNQHVDLDT